MARNKKGSLLSLLPVLLLPPPSPPLDSLPRTTAAHSQHRQQTINYSNRSRIVVGAALTDTCRELSSSRSSAREKLTSSREKEDHVRPPGSARLHPRPLSDPAGARLSSRAATMCGILAVLNATDDSAAMRSRVLALSRRQRHRGPDW